MEGFLETLPAWVEAFRFPVLGRLLLATALGGLIGLERELAGKPAGLRTNILICLGAALLTEASILIATSFVPHDLVRTDPGRIAAQVVSGIGFIGAGTIIVARGSVLGLTTAATLWVVAAIGITVGVRAYVEAIGATVLVLIVLVLIGLLENRFFKARAEHTLRVTVTGPRRGSDLVEGLLRDAGVRAELVSVARDPEAARYAYTVAAPTEALRTLTRRLAGMEGVSGVALD